VSEENQTEVGITFKAHFARFATQADGALRVSFDLSPNEAQSVLKLLKVQGQSLQVAIIPEPKQEEKKAVW
jgi:hypothetical protein